MREQEDIFDFPPFDPPPPRAGQGPVPGQFMDPAESARMHEVIARSTGLPEPGSRTRGLHREADFADIFPGKQGLSQQEQLTREIIELIKDIKASVDELPQKIAVAMAR